MFRDLCGGRFGQHIQDQLQRGHIITEILFFQTFETFILPGSEQLLRIIQSIPSPKAEPFKMWLAQVGRERIEETIDPELTIERALETYQRKGYSREWINQRLQAIQVRKELTDEWDFASTWPAPSSFRRCFSFAQ